MKSFTRALNKNLKWIYLSYFAVVLTALFLFLNDSDNLASPVLVTSVVGLHFVFAGYLTLTTKNMIKKRYTPDIYGIVAGVSDLMLVASLILCGYWLKNHEEYNKESLVPIFALVTAFVGNIGCFILRFLKK